MTKSPRKNVSDIRIELGAACMPSGHTFDRATAPIVSETKVSSRSMVSVAKATGLILTWSHTTKDRFSRDKAQKKLVLMRAITLSLLNTSRVLGV